MRLAMARKKSPKRRPYYESKAMNPALRELMQTPSVLEKSTTALDLIKAGKPYLPTDPQERKTIPLCTGCFDYFPLALLEIAKLSKVGNDQHNPGEPLHWARGKSTDQADTILRHLAERGGIDVDNVR